MKLSGKISICRSTSNREPYNVVSITIEDETSHTQVARIELSPEAFGNAVTGLSCQPCEIDWNTNNLGKTYEHKTETVPYANKYGTNTEADQASALKPFEVDGWKGDLSDLTNHHKHVEGGQRVRFVRWV